MSNPTFTLRRMLLPLLLGATMLSACTTPLIRTDTNTASSTATTADSRQHAGPTIDWAGLKRDIEAALAGTTDVEVLAPATNSLDVRIPVSNGFSSGSADIRPPLAAALDRIAPTLVQHPEVALQILGHTDSTGSEMYNLQLSIKRSEAVMEHLRKHGITLERMSADGKGEAEPIADNAGESGRARNRRVEIHLKASD